VGVCIAVQKMIRHLHIDMQGVIMHAKDMTASGQFWYLITDTSRVTDVQFPPHPTLFCGPHSRLSNAYLELFPVDTWNSFE
jgi:hypothetical protein